MVAGEIIEEMAQIIAEITMAQIMVEITMVKTISTTVEIVTAMANKIITTMAKTITTGEIIILLAVLSTLLLGWLMEL